MCVSAAVAFYRRDRVYCCVETEGGQGYAGRGPCKDPARVPVSLRQLGNTNLDPIEKFVKTSGYLYPGVHTQPASYTENDQNLWLLVPRGFTRNRHPIEKMVKIHIIYRKL